ncbi:hypothetical protein FQA39_LY05865 [Lamprigera yunnana]|nr:hypothetical protein FQA39_LY05865 [Lamprigera yunnana]
MILRYFKRKFKKRTNGNKQATQEEDQEEEGQEEEGQEEDINPQQQNLGHRPAKRRPPEIPRRRISYQVNESIEDVDDMVDGNTSHSEAEDCDISKPKKRLRKQHFWKRQKAKMRRNKGEMPKVSIRLFITCCFHGCAKMSNNYERLTRLTTAKRPSYEIQEKPTFPSRIPRKPIFISKSHPKEKKRRVPTKASNNSNKSIRSWPKRIDYSINKDNIPYNVNFRTFLPSDAETNTDAL